MGKMLVPAPAEQGSDQEITELLRQLSEANNIVDAIRRGEVDALLVNGNTGGRVFVLDGADHVYRLIVEEMQEGYATLDDRGVILFCNRRFAAMLKEPLEQVIGTSVHSRLAKRERRKPGGIDLSHGRFRGELNMRASDGSQFPVLATFSTVALGKDTFTCLLVTDLSELKDSQRFNQLILEQSADAIIACDSPGRIVSANRAATALFGNLAAGSDFATAVPLTDAGDGTPFRLSAVNKTPLVRREVVLRRPDGAGIHLLLSACRFPNEMGYVVSLTDVTETRRLASEITRLDKMNLVGEMAAGIGHEVRNPMTTVRGYLQRFSRKNSFAEYRGEFELMIEELDRANSIISEYLSLAKTKAVDIKVADLNRVVTSLFPLIEADAMRRGQNVRLELQRGIPPVSADEKEMRQCILNLVANGLDATPPGGTVTVGTASLAVRTMLTVRDEGQGIPSHVREKMGLPFFTTKENGTGLGLSVCYRIAERHRASIEVDTGPQGTTFKFVFPL